MNTYSNDWKTWRRLINDYLPHDLRRTVFRLRNRTAWNFLQAMRAPGGAGLYHDLSAFLTHQAIFVHVPKAAGNSVSKALFDERTGGHTTLYVYRLAFSRTEFRRMFKFTFVRNPWDRCHSAYHFLMAGGLNEWDRANAEQYLARYKTFEHFVLRGLGTPSIMKLIHFLPITNFIEVRPGIMPLDFIGYFEQFDADLNRVASHIGCDAMKPTWENRTVTKPLEYIESYSSAMREKVAAVYDRDISLLGYSFDGVRPHPLNLMAPQSRQATGGDH